MQGVCVPLANIGLLNARKLEVCGCFVWTSHELMEDTLLEAWLVLFRARFEQPFISYADVGGETPTG